MTNDTRVTAPTTLPSVPLPSEDLLNGPPPAAQDGDMSPALASSSPWRLAMRRFRRNRLALAGLVLIGAVALLALLAPLIAQHDPNATNAAAFRSPPSGEHWLGTDSAGRDVFSRLLDGARISLTVGIAAALSATAIGTVLGLLAGMLRGWVDALIMRLVDTVLSFPSLVVIILLAAIIGPSVTSIILVIALFGWPTPCRVVRQMSLSLREMDFVLAARAIGASNRQIMFRHVMAGVLGPLTVVTTLLSAGAVLMEASLSFLGLGVKQPQATWGGMLQEAQSLSILQDMPWLWLPPGLAIALTVLSINFIGDGLRDALDPRQQS